MENKPEEIELKNPCPDCCERLICSFGSDPDYLLCEKLNQYQSDKEAFNKLKAGKALIHDTLEKYRGTALLDQQVIKDLKDEISQLKADKKQMILDVAETLGIYEDELGFVSISNHVPFESWQSFKERWLK